MLWKCYRMLNINMKLAKQSTLSRSLSEHPTFVSFLLRHSVHTRPDTYKHTHTRLWWKPLVNSVAEKGLILSNTAVIRSAAVDTSSLSSTQHAHTRTKWDYTSLDPREFLIHSLSSVHPLSLIKKLKWSKYKMPRKWNPCGQFYSTR